MPRVRANGLDLEYETDGSLAASPLLLVMGLGGQLTWWEPGFCEALVARGFRMIRYDNRDTGLSTWFDEAGEPDFGAIMAGVAAPTYRLSDMAEDAAGLLTALDIQRAHIVGMSMGGMIAQQLAIDHPERVLTLTSIMSSVGGKDAIAGEPEVQAALWESGGDTLDGEVEAWLRGRRLNMGPNASFNEQVERARAVAELTRARNPAGVSRQLAAIIAAPSRRQALASLPMPVLVVHGLDDPLVPPDNGRMTAASVPGARLMLIEAMGHNLAPHALGRIADAIAELAAGVDA
jgi:pimeloyl-ACP methyl ester carboxylesterase